MGANHSLEKKVIFFDGVCNLCNSSVQFVIKRDPEKRFFFAALQSEYAKSNLSSNLANESNLQSIVLLKEGKTLTKSTAALSIAKELSGLWPILYLFVIIPRPLRDSIYDLIGRNRYKWFGKQDHCMIPTKELKDRFYD